MEPESGGVVAQKKALRSIMIAARKGRSAGAHSVAARRNDDHLVDLMSGTAVVCGYLPLASEPMTRGVLDRLADAGTAVLVPVVSADRALDWCRYPGPTAPGAFGIAEPTGPRLGPGAVRRADAILVPALAVDSTGRRLGRGGGHYDRTLALLPSRTGTAVGPELIAVLFDGELVEVVPSEDHDRRVGSAVLPTAGVVHFRS